MPKRAAEAQADAKRKPNKPLTREQRDRANAIKREQRSAMPPEERAEERRRRLEHYHATKAERSEARNARAREKRAIAKSTAEGTELYRAQHSAKDIARSVRRRAAMSPEQKEEVRRQNREYYHATKGEKSEVRNARAREKRALKNSTPEGRADNRAKSIARYAKTKSASAKRREEEAFVDLPPIEPIGGDGTDEGFVAMMNAMQVLARRRGRVIRRPTARRTPRRRSRR